MPETPPAPLVAPPVEPVTLGVDDIPEIELGIFNAGVVAPPAAPAPVIASIPGVEIAPAPAGAPAP